MSRERARRRAAREAAAAAARDRHRREAARASARSRARRGRRDRLTRLAGRFGLRWSRPPSRLRARRRRQDAVVLGLLLAVQVVVWVVTDSWGWRAAALALSVGSWPVLTTLLFDRRAGG